MLVDGDRTAKQLWHELAQIYTISSKQKTANLQAKLEFFSFKDGDDWEKHVSTFLSIIDERASEGKALTDAEKVTKLLRTPPESFDPLEMASSLNENSFDEIVGAV